MFLIRRATVDDAPTLLKLAKMVHFINLPADIELIRGRIARSLKRFTGQVADQPQRDILFAPNPNDVVVENVRSQTRVASEILGAG